MTLVFSCSQLDKVYEAKNSPEEDDPREREEEMARMREHVFKEMDKDKNFRISFNEFIDYTGRDGDNPEFKKDDGWKVRYAATAFFQVKKSHGPL